MLAAVLGGLGYAGSVFAVGFALGTVRVLVLAPWLGAFAAVALELPVILLASWYLAGVLVRRAAVPATVPARALMGATALVALLVAEALLAVLAFGRTFGAHLAAYGTPAGALGLAGQFAFAALPTVRGLRGHRPPAPGPTRPAPSRRAHGGTPRRR